MNAISVAARVLLPAGVFLTLFLPGYASGLPPMRISPEVVQVGLTFGGAEVRVEGTAPSNAQVVVKVSTEPAAVGLGRKGRVLGIFWMTTERAVVENMPTFHAVYVSQPLETLLNRDNQIRIGADAEYLGIMSKARAVGESKAALPPREAGEYVTNLRDIYIKKGKYAACVSCHQAKSSRSSVLSPGSEPELGRVQLMQGDWDLRFRLPADTPLGDYEVTAYYVRAGQVVSSESSGFSVSKTGLVDALGKMATESPPAYGLLSLVTVVLGGLSIAYVFPKAGH